MDQTTAFPESAVRPQGKEPVAAPDIALLPKLGVWDLKHHPRNVRKHNLDAIAKAMRRYGQMSPIVVQLSTGYVVKGNGTLKAARDVLGWGHIYGSVVEMDDDTALSYLLDDNRASDLADYDKAALSKLLKEQEAGGRLQDSLWDLDDAETLWAEMGDITITDPEQFKGGFAETPEEMKARAAKLEKSGPALREVVLALKAEDYEEFAVNVARLARAYGTKGVIATVIEAIRRAASQVVA